MTDFNIGLSRSPERLRLHRHALHRMPRTGGYPFSWRAGGASGARRRSWPTWSTSRRQVSLALAQGARSNCERAA
eukprot:5399755-Pyramimonas_sp.AAC.1